MLTSPSTPMKKLSLAISVMLLSSVGMSSAYADERESLEQLKATTTNLIDLLVKEGVLPKDKADAIVKQANEDAARQVKQAKAQEMAISGEKPAPIDEKSVRVQYVPEHIKKEMREEIKQEVMAKLNYKAGERLGMPSWIDRFSFHGDIRLRGQTDNFSENNASIAQLNDPERDMNLRNASEERRRLRVRARLGADVKVNDWLVGGLQFTTGLLNTPVTPNQTEGMAQGKYVFGLDRAFLKADVTPWLSLQGGRFGNPFLSTDVLWDPDLAFDGFAASFTPKFNDSWSSFTTIGAFPIEEVESSEVNDARDKWFYSLQTGIKWQAPNKSSFKLAVAYHDYKNVEGRLNSVGLTENSGTAPAFRQRGNNTFDINVNNTTATSTPIIGTASKFEQINLLGQLDLMQFAPLHVTLTGDYVKNIGFDKKEILRRTGNIYKEETDAYQVRLDIGHDSFNAFNNGQPLRDVQANDWQISLAYKRIEADSVLDAFTDSNFSLGGTNTKGWALVGNYGIDKNAWVGARYLTADSISGFPFSVDVFLLDMNARF
jgi:Putative porin